MILATRSEADSAGAGRAVSVSAAALLSVTAFLWSSAEVTGGVAEEPKLRRFKRDCAVADVADAGVDVMVPTAPLLAPDENGGAGLEGKGRAPGAWDESPVDAERLATWDVCEVAERSRDLGLRFAKRAWRSLVDIFQPSPTSEKRGAKLVMRSSARDPIAQRSWPRMSQLGQEHEGKKERMHDKSALGRGRVGRFRRQRQRYLL